MKRKKRVNDEAERLQALAEFDLVRTPPEPEFDRLVALAARVFRVPIALMTLVDEERVHLKASVGMDFTDLPRENSLCSHALESGDVMVIPDTRQDARFRDHPLVCGGPNIRFYAGAKLVTPSGHAVGTLCVIDTEPRKAPGKRERAALRDFTELIMREMELRRLRHVEAKANRVQQAFEDRDRQFKLLVDSLSDHALCMLDPDGLVVSWNAGAERTKGYREEEILGQHFSVFYPEEDRAAGKPGEALTAAIGEGRFEAEALRIRKDGSRFWANVTIDPIHDCDGQHVGFAKITRDITQQHQQRQHLHRLAHYDALTELPNRFSVCEYLDGQLREGRPLALLVLDLNGFKEINDALGHPAGDAVLRAAARRIRSAVHQSGMVGRIGGDEFAVVLPNSADPLRAGTQCEALIEALRPAIDWQGRGIHLGVAIGMTLVDEGGHDSETLFTQADLALCQAKATGKYAHRMFEPRVQHEALARRKCEEELHRAVARGELELFFQPQVRMADRRIIGAEALLRWRHPERGLVAPGAFISVLENSVLASQVGEWIIDTACAHAARVRAAGLVDYSVSINLFGVQLRNPSFRTAVNHALWASHLPASAIELEITENIALEREGNVVELLTQLRADGVRIAFDDYGTGFASLSLLKGFPLDRLKIDYSFVHDIDADLQNAAVVRAILELAETFDLQVTAEGIETVAQEHLLASMGCRFAQGYLYGRPMPGDEMLARVAEQLDQQGARSRKTAG